MLQRGCSLTYAGSAAFCIHAEPSPKILEPTFTKSQQKFKQPLWKRPEELTNRFIGAALAKMSTS
ncbi:hypothetical protein ACVWWI_006739 [Bradyrhizobium sp. USDA 3686]|nr:hypothetical protein [Bradyrhizobium canariense]